MKKLKAYVTVFLCVVLCVWFVPAAHAEGNYGADTTSEHYRSNLNPFYRTSYPSLIGQCTWYSWGRAREKCGVTLAWGDGTHLGDAGDWLSSAAAAGYATGTTPRSNSIVVWAKGGGLTYGHVAFVEVADGNTIYITEYNYNVSKGYSEAIIDVSTGYRNETYGSYGKYPAGKPAGFIYLDDNQPTSFLHNLDVCEAGSNSIHVAGWAFNRANITESIEIHAYLDSAFLGGFRANISRKDVDNAYHVGEFHGFDYTFTNVPAGEHTLNLYAIDGNSNSHFDPIQLTVYPSGTPMSSSEQAIPDGSYIIAFAGSTNKGDLTILDIPGSETTAADGSNVTIFIASEGDVAPYDIWDVAYHPDSQFYSIKQRGTNMALSVYEPEASNVRANVQVNTDRGSDAQMWAISQDSNRMGYQIRSKASGFALEVPYGVDESGRNVHQWLASDSLFETWLFIPYQPSQPVEDGRYIILSTVADGIELDVQGDSGDIADETPVQLWDDSALSQFNSFDLVRLTTGYYKIKHAASGKCLEVTRGTSGYGDRVNVYGDNGSIAQQWAIIPNGDGFALIVRSSGYALDSDEGETANSTRVQQYPLHGRSNQTWKFVKAEYTVGYDANGGTNAPEAQTKYYKYALTLSNTIPTRTGFKFKGWQADGVIYAPGAAYTLDHDATIKAVWQADKYTVSYDANGGSGAPAAQQFSTGTATLSSVKPTRSHYRFLGWATSNMATTAEYLPGSEYTGGVDITLYAIWERSLENLLILPKALTVIEAEAFLSTDADAVVIPATVTSIGRNAFDADIAICGYTGTTAETYARQNNMTFIPLMEHWVLTEDVPDGAKVTDQKWTYLQTSSETMKSTESPVDGWTQAD